MPRVPTYDGPQVQSNALQPVYQRTPDVSSGLRAVAGGLSQVAQVAEGIQRREEEAQANRIDTEISAGWLQWDAENRRKYQGQNAAGYEAAAAEWWQKASEAHGKDLTPGARARIGQALARKRASALSAVSSYVGAETERWADDQAEAAAQTTITMGVSTGDPAGAAERVRALAAEKGARKGWTTEQVQAEQARLLGTLHLSYVTQVAEQDAARAQTYYEDAKKRGEIPPAVQAKVEAVLKGEADNQFAEQFAAQHATLPRGEQVAKAGEIADPERRKKALAMIRDNATLMKAAQAEREAAASDEAWQLVGQGKRVPESVLVRMNGRSRVELQEHLVDRARITADRAAGKPPKTNWATYIDLRERLANGEDVDLRPYAETKIAGPQLEQLLDIKTKGKTDKDVATAVQQLSTYSAQLKLTKEKRGQFEAAAQAEFDAWKQAHGGKLPTFEERRKILDALVMERDNEWWQFGTKRAYEMTPGERAETALKPSATVRSAAQPPAGPVRVTSLEQARALPKGTRFIDPDGIERIR